MKFEKTVSNSFCVYRIADHNINIFNGVNADMAKCLPSFEPFKSDSAVSGKFLLTIELSEIFNFSETEASELLSDVTYIMDESFRMEKQSESYITKIIGGKGRSNWVMKSSKDFYHSIIYLPASETYTTNKLSWLIMIAFGQACLSEKTILMHSSVVLHKNLGYAFLGKSGTGKSTHSRLWLQHVKGSELLNDDNPAIRVMENHSVFVYGTPWSGKTPCFKNIKVQLAGITRLEQGSKNELVWKHGMEALVSVLPSGAGIRWDDRIYSQLLDVLELLIVKVPIGHLINLPIKEAAELHATAYQIEIP